MFFDQHVWRCASLVLHVYVYAYCACHSYTNVPTITVHTRFNILQYYERVSIQLHYTHNWNIDTVKYFWF